MIPYPRILSMETLANFRKKLFSRFDIEDANYV